MPTRSALVRKCTAVVVLGTTRLQTCSYLPSCSCVLQTNTTHLSTNLPASLPTHLSASLASMSAKLPTHLHRIGRLLSRWPHSMGQLGCQRTPQRFLPSPSARMSSGCSLSASPAINIDCSLSTRAILLCSRRCYRWRLERSYWEKGR